MGTAVADFYDEHTGKNFTNYGNSTVISRIMAVTKKVEDTRLPVLSFAQNAIDGRNHKKVQILFIPFVDNQDEITQLFGLFELDQ